MSSKYEDYHSFETDSAAARQRRLEQQSESRVNRLAAELSSAEDLDVDMERVDEHESKQLADYRKNAKKDLASILAEAARREAEARSR